jgi:hypothetical protein
MPSFKKGEVVSIKPNKTEEPVVCFVSKGGNSLNLVYYSNKTKDLRQFSNVNSSHPDLNLSTYSKMPKKLKDKHDIEFKSLKKGAIVEFDNDGETTIGVVEKGGNMPTIVYDNGSLAIKGHASLFTEIDDSKLEKDEPSVMDKWTVVSYKEHKRMSEETIAFNAYIALNGKKVFAVENTGKGGCMSLHGCSSVYDKKSNDLFEKDLLEWAKQFGMTWKPFELDEEWVLWFSRDKPLKVTAKQHFEREKKQRKEIGLETELN